MRNIFDGNAEADRLDSVLGGIAAIERHEETDAEDAKSHSTMSNVVHLPLDYDTDVLRTDFRQMTGEYPGPITKNTKRLYLKQLAKLKLQPEARQVESNLKKCKFPMKLGVIMKFQSF